jgi:membrane protease YdiL (CAAX protease family)
VLLGEGVLLGAALLSAAVMARIEKRSFAEYALPRKGAFGPKFWSGVTWGYLALTSVILVMRALRAFYFGTLAVSGGALILYAVLWAASFVAVGCFEEFVFRGYPLYTLTTGMGFWPAAVLLSLCFGALHLRNAGENRIGILNVVLIGMFFCLTVRRTGSLWFAIGLHSMWDYAESFLYSVPDSGLMAEGHLLNSSFRGPPWLTGGSDGPEGSVLALIVIAVMVVIFDRLYRQAQFPVKLEREFQPLVDQAN